MLVGSEAALSGGAVSAVIDDGSSLWFNPAGLANVLRNQVDTSISATQLRLSQSPALLETSSGKQSDGSYQELAGIPTAVTGARPLSPGLVFGFGVFVPRHLAYTDRVRLEEKNDQDLFQLQLVQQANAQEYYAGVGMGLALSPHLRVGLSLFGIYTQFSLVSQFFGGRFNDQDAAIAGFSSLSFFQSVGLALGAGMQWNPNDEIGVGLSFRSPSLQVGVLRRLNTIEVGARSSSSTIVFEPLDEYEVNSQLAIIQPAHLRVGLSYRFPKGWISADASFTHPLSAPQLGIERDWLWNLRIGGRYAIEPELALGGGVFTDRSPLPAIRGYGETRVDFVGASAGIEIRTFHRLAEGEPTKSLVFCQVLAVSYAIGLGKVGGLRITNDLNHTEWEVYVREAPTRIHEFAFYTGSALEF
ncbi:MAG: outer membrane protein transport protein [Sandaracinaceae bacterium]|nr:outer membrane protein transport protein [Sandaracinaceae bacterium]